MSYLDFLIHNCLREYADDYIPSAIDESTAQSTQSDKCIDVPLLVAKSFFNIQSKNLISPTTSDIAGTSPARPAQTDKFAFIPFVNPKRKLLSLKHSNLKSPVSPDKSQKEVSKVASKGRFTCLDCGESFQGNKQLLRHQLKHSAPNKYSCPIVGCKMKTYRLDGMRSHVKCHERRILKDEQALRSLQD
jgi:hypothetical protein